MAHAIVVGGGLSGLSAAHTIYQRGGRVLVLDKNGFFGGNSTKATSGINGSSSSTQADLNIEDSNKLFFDDTKKSARDLARDDLIKVLTYKSGDAVDWIQESFGLKLTKVSRLGGHSAPRTHRGSEQFPGMAITYALMEALEDIAENDPERVTIIKKANVTKLVQSQDGTVTGVEYEHDGQSKSAQGPVILATGGYAADFSEDGLLKKYRPDTLKLSTTNGDHCTGDGHKMVMAIKGKVVDMEKVQVHPTGLIDPNEPDAKTKFLAAEALRGCGGLLLDSEGNRFADELGHRDYVTGRIWENGKYPVRLILNQKASQEIEWHCKHYTGRGLMKKIEGFKGLAKEMNLSESKIKSVYDDYAQVAQGKRKDPFGKKYFDNWETSPSDTFYVAQMEPVLHYTMGGVEINPESQVIGSDGKPIPGLWASGELAGGVHGANRLGGSSLLGCVVFGRVAGDGASAYLFKDMAKNGGGYVAQQRLGQISNHLETKIRINPEDKNVTLSFSWANSGASSLAPAATGSAAHTSSAPQSSKPGPSEKESTTTAGPDGPGKGKSAPVKKELKEISLDEVAKHNKKEDIWVGVNGQVLDVTKFLPDHPGGPKAILLYAGKECSEEFNMLHDPKVIAKYAPDTIIGTYKQ